MARYPIPLTLLTMVLIGCSQSPKEEKQQSVAPTPEQRFGLTEPQRKEIFAEQFRTEHRAYEEALKRFPMDIMRRAEEEERLIEKYDSEIRARYGITKEVYAKIVFEGIEKGWPRP